MNKPEGQKPLLRLEKLTVRFGGLTAVNGVDCQLDERQIVSIIGPNGAGKTTLFNAVTGIYAPTAGRIEFAGRQLARPLTWRVRLGCLAVGVLMGLSAFLTTFNIDGMWRATIKRNYAGPGHSFSYGAAWLSALDYLSGQLAVTSVRGRWSVVTADGRRTLGFARDEPEARRMRERLSHLMGHLDSDPGLIAAVAADQLSQQRGSVEVVHRPDGLVLLVQTVGAGSFPLGEFESGQAAVANLENLAALGQQRSRRLTHAELALALGFVVGCLGTYAVWERSRRTPDVIALAGIARTFQNIRLFQNMTVLENVLSGMDRQFHAGVLRMALRTPGVKREEAAGIGRAGELLRFVGLEQRSNDLAKNLAYGEQRRLEIARALATEPRVLLLDEPAAGMNPIESAELSRLIDQLRGRGVAVLLIEHHMRLVMGISDRIAVLDYGSKIAEGTPAEVRADPAVVKAYLGSEEIG